MAMSDKTDIEPGIPDREFAESLRGLLRDSENRLDFNATTRLAAARARALDQAGRFRWRRWTLVIPGAALAAALVWALLLPGEFMLSRAPRSPAATPVDVVESSADEAELLINLEFYQWLDEAGDNV
jgi:hypothetical protein